MEVHPGSLVPVERGDEDAPAGEQAGSSLASETYAGRTGPGGSPHSGGGRTPAVLVHGFTQGSWSWQATAEQLAGTRGVTCADLPGHGGSRDVSAGLWRTAGLLADVVPRPAFWVGYSLGGRACLHLALSRPDLVRGLVLIGAHPGIADEAERNRRRRADWQLAARLDPPPEHPDAADPPQVRLDRFLQRWLANPMFAGLDRRSAGLERRRENDPAGLAQSLRLAGTGSQEPLWGRLGELDMPVLVVAGQRDAKFTALGRRAAGLIGANARFEEVPGAGHPAHVEAPDHFSALLGRWIDSVEAIQVCEAVDGDTHRQAHHPQEGRPDRQSSRPTARANP